MKKDNKYIIDDLLVKQLLGEATKQELDYVKEWLLQSPQNQKHYNDFVLIWEQSKQLETTTIVDEQAAWAKLLNRINSDGSQDSSYEHTTLPNNKIIPLYKNTWLRIAAALLILVGSAWLAFNFTWQVTRQANELAITETLPDGSVVVLNRNSSVTYPSRFLGSTRSVTLKGEAFFTVTPNKEKPFVIAANEAMIKVVGTSFNVKSAAAKTEVIVETGIVEVAKQRNAVLLKPQQKATVTTGNMEPVMEQNTDELYNYYRTKEFVCNRTPLYKLTNILSEAYDVQIIIDDEKIKQMPLTTVFHNEPLDNILDVICATFNLRSTKNGNEIKLYSK